MERWITRFSSVLNAIKARRKAIGNDLSWIPKRQQRRERSSHDHEKLSQRGKEHEAERGEQTAESGKHEHLAI